MDKTGPSRDYSPDFKKRFAAVAMALMVVTATASAKVFGMDDGLRITLAMTVACVVPLVAYGSRRWATRGGLWLMLAVGTVVAWCGIADVWSWTLGSGAPLAHPQLFADDRHYYEWALYHFDGSGEPLDVMFPGFPLLMVGLWRLFGVSVAWPVAMNVSFTLLAMVVAAATARRMLTGKVSTSGQTVAVLTMATTGLLSFFISQGIRIQKEAIVYLAIVLVGYSLAGLRDCHLTRRDTAIFIVACVMLAFGRTTYLYFVMLGVGMMAMTDVRRLWRPALTMGTVAILLFVVGNHFAYYSIERHVVIVNGGNAMRECYVADGAQQPYLNLIGDYFNYPILKRLLMLPLTMGVQFMIPLPWLHPGVAVSIDTLLPRLGYGWYAVGAMAIFYFFAVSWRRRDCLGWWPWWLAASYAVIAYITAGSVNRYILPFEPLMAVLATYVLCRAADGCQRKALVAWLVGFAVVIAVALGVCSRMMA